MKRKFEIRPVVAVLALAVASIGGGLIASVTSGRAVPVFVTTAQAASVEASPMVSFGPVVKRSSPAVVKIDSTKVIKASEQRRSSRNGGGTPFDDPFFRQFFGDNSPLQPRDRREQGLGSGVIVSPEGYIMTNNHVVADATSVKVTLSDRREFTAKVVGTDPQTDVALLKIEASKLPVLPLSSSKPDVGDVVLAIGNPYGIGQTVTMGIVSATGRNLGGAIESYEDFIQTDASINPGNSGGALINSRGELIGINTAIIPSGGGGNQGIGFAIPVTMAKNVMEQLMRSGKVTRGYMGATLQDVDPSLAKAFKLPNTDGALVNEVSPDTPADKAGLKSGDVITQLNGEPVTDRANLRLRVASLAPGSVAKLHVLRDGTPRDVNITLGERPADDVLARNARGGSRGGERGHSTALDGVSVDDMNAQIARQLQLPAGTTGVVVTDVDESSAAAEAGLRRGDVIEQVNRTAVRNTNDFDRQTRNASGQVLLLVNRQEQSLYIAIEAK